MLSNLYYFDPCAARACLRKLGRAYGLISIPRNGDRPFEWQTPAVVVADTATDDLLLLQKLAPKSDAWWIICLLGGSTRIPAKLKSRVFALLPRDAPRVVLGKTVAMAFETLRAQKEHDRTRRELQRAVSDLETLNKIGVALSTERNTDALLESILSKSREITSSDAGSLYLVEQDEKSGTKRLVFNLTQNDTHPVHFTTFRLPIDTRSIAGYAAATGQLLNIKDAYRIKNLPFQLNREFDQNFGYRSKSMLVVPMRNQKGQIIGVLQLINCKKHPGAKLTTPEVVRKEVVPFSPRSQDLACSLASQAAVALENNTLYTDIERQFDSFVDASMTAIEARDPTTVGHSERVATLTVRLAETVSGLDSGPYKDIHFTREDIRELRYAAKLHDFGKVGVREEVLVKAKKLYDSQLAVIKQRFQYIQKALELKGCRKKLEHLLHNGHPGHEECFARIDLEQRRELEHLDDFLQHILQANEPTVLPEKTSEKLAQIAAWNFDDFCGPIEPLLTQEELQVLSIPKGSLNPEERTQLETHVIHSVNFLKKIRWTKELSRVPEIAKFHHEKLDGSGYPYHMKSQDIPLQSKMMAIADVFDALTASDRPYKRAVPIERALTIIGSEVKSQLLDRELFNLFVNAKIYELTAND